MKHNHNKYYNLVAYTSGLVLMLGFMLPFSVKAAPLDLVTIPLANSPTVPIQSNLLFIFDDSGSMGDDSMPDTSSSTYAPHYKNSAYNTITYNPAILYSPPAYFTSTGLNTTTYLSQTGAATANGANATTKPNWKSVERDAYGVLSTTNDDLTDKANYFTTLPGNATIQAEYCTKADLKDCALQAGPTTARPYLAAARWCKSVAIATSSATPAYTAATNIGDCQATNATVGANSYLYLRAASPRTATITMTQGGTNRKVNTITAGGQIMSTPTTSSTNSAATNAAEIAASINACTNISTGACSVTGYSAIAAGATVTIYAPANSTSNLALTVVTNPLTTGISNTTAFSKAPLVSLIQFTSGANRRVDGFTVSGQQIMSASTAVTGNAAQMVSFIEAIINNCTSVATGNCTIAGYSASASGDILTIYSPASIIAPATPAITQAGGSGGPTINAFTSNNAPGQMVYTVIKDATATYKYPGTATKAATRSDCAGTACSYAEEMTNYANWYSYYRTRNQMMKTATSLAFKDIGDDFRVGFLTTSTLSARALNLARFNTAQKALWYTKLLGTVADRSTPLRGALSKAGRIYAKKETIGGVFSDPIEYECQQNFTLLTTDGFWNTADETATYAGGPFKVDGATNVGNQDSGTSVPTGKREGSGALSFTNSLADVAKYYRDTDLRTPLTLPDGSAGLNNCTGALGSSVCETPSSTGAAPNQKQTMVTLTMGLGADGLLSYVASYDKVAGDYKDITAGTKNWPLPAANTPTAIDDLWHAAVNGDGTYFSAKNPADVVSQLKEAIASIKVKTGSGAAAATSTLNPVSGDNFAYVASYTSGYWIGNLQRRTIDTSTGEVSKSATHCVEDVVPTASCASPSTIVPDGSGGYDCVTSGVTDPTACSGTLDGTDCKVPVSVSCSGSLKTKVSAFTSSARIIKMNVAGTLQDFDYTNLTVAQKTYFDTPWLTANLTQWPSLTAPQQTNATGVNLVKYLRGETGYDLASAVVDNRIFRKRQATLGDLIDSKPAFIGKPVFDYTDPGYQSYKTAQAGRAKTVYVGSNDGMLHAFNADTLDERWAFVPTLVIPNMWKLADSNYSAKHANYVNGDIIISDICTANCALATATWKTILVAGLNGGGRGYYALDITNPTTPTLLWEFDAKSASIKGDLNLGYSYGNPIITKRNIDGKWVVLFTSGYNNIPDNDSFYSLSTTNFKPNNPATFTTGNGGGYLYVVDAASGDRLAAIPTLNASSVNVGDTTTPSGLAKIKAYADDAEKNNATTDVYGGDLLGNMWRFNIDTNSAFNFSQLQAGAVQPITVAPELGLVNNKRVIIVGTGKYLEVADLLNANQQTLYAIKDDNANTTLVNPRATLVPQTIVPDGADTRKSGTANPVNFVLDRGWYVDFPDPRERQNVASRLVLGTLLVPTTVPQSSACQPAGYGWFNFLDYRTGLAVVTNPSSSIVSQRTTAPSVGFNVVYVDGKPKVSNVVADDENPKLIPDIPFSGSGTGFQLKRSIWREIIE